MKNKLFILLITIALADNTCFAQHLHPEKYYQTIWCEANRGMAEYKLPDYTRIDCLTSQYAVEFDFAKKWAESIGQSLYYASKTGKTPAIGLILEQPKDIIYYNRILPLCAHLGIRIFKIY